MAISKLIENPGKDFPVCFNVVCFPCSSVSLLTQVIVFSFQEIDVGSQCSGLGNYAFFNSRAPASFQFLSEVSSLVFIFSKERACDKVRA